MVQQIIIAEKVRIAALIQDERVEELIVAKGRYQIGDVYLGTIENVLPGIDAAFVNIGESEKNGFIHVSDLGPLRLKKTSAAITELLEPKQKVMVQVIKEPTGNKGARLTGNISFPGRYLVLQPFGQGVNLSRRISTENERNRLRALGVLIKPPGTGLLIRTEAESIKEELLINDLEDLLKKWDSIQQLSEIQSPPFLLNRDEDFIQRVLRDNVSSSVKRIVVENDSAVERVKHFLGKNENNIAFEAHKEPIDIFKKYKINLAIHNALQPRVDLPSGGYIIIEPTEALTVIDVNSGSFTRSANARETVLWTNCEAAKEIARQLKLRNIGGVVVIDFIDMDSRKDQLQLLEHFTTSIKDDSARPQIAQLTELGLLELTRKRQGQNIYELFGKPCKSCFGIGTISSFDEVNSINLNIEIDNNESNIIQNEKIISQKENDINNLDQKQDDLIQHSQTDIKNEQNQTLVNSENISDNQQVKQTDEIKIIHLNEVEEEVYRSIGLNPVLLDDSYNSSINTLSYIVKPDEKEEDIIEKAKAVQFNNNNKNRKKGKYNSKFNNKSIQDNESRCNTENINEDIEEVKSQVEINEFEIQVDNQGPVIEELETINSDEIKDIKDNQIEELEDPRRKRRRSSATN